MKHFGEIAFTDTVKAQHARNGSRDAYRNLTDSPAPNGFSDREVAFIAARNSFYMASVSETGWPYMQHRGGPAGFLKVLSPTRLAFADYRGNRQYVSTGNVLSDPRVSLFLMDYPNTARLKLLGRAQVKLASDAPDLAAKLAVPDQGKVERLFMIDVDAFDWNCPQFITPRYTTEELAETLAPYVEEIRQLRTEVAFLKARSS